MTRPGRRRRWGLRVLAVLAGVGLASATAYGLVSGGVTSSPDGERLRVVGAQSGDVLDVTTMRNRRLVRLAGVEAPRRTSDGGVQCLADEAHEALERLAPTGSPVTLRHAPGTRGWVLDGRGAPRQGEDGAEVSSVYDHQDRLIAVELARRGLVVPDADDQRDAEALAQGFDHARSEGAGFYDEDLACTVPGQVRARITGLQQALGPRQRWADEGPAPAPARVDAALASATELWRHLSAVGPHRDAPEWRALSSNDTALLRMRLEAAIVGAQAVRFNASTLAEEG